MASVEQDVSVMMLAFAGMEERVSMITMEFAVQPMEEFMEVDWTAVRYPPLVRMLDPRPNVLMEPPASLRVCVTNLESMQESVVATMDSSAMM
jgi:hypothetical protein